MRIDIRQGQITSPTTINLTNVRCDRFTLRAPLQLQFGIPTIPAIAHAVAQAFGITAESMQVHTSVWEIAHPRLVAMALAREVGHLQRSTAHYFGMHSSMPVHAQNKVKDWEDTKDPRMAQKIKALRQQIGITNGHTSRTPETKPETNGSDSEARQD